MTQKKLSQRRKNRWEKEAKKEGCVGIIVSRFRKKFSPLFVKKKEDFDVLKTWIKMGSGRIIYSVKF